MEVYIQQRSSVHVIFCGQKGLIRQLLVNNNVERFILDKNQIRVKFEEVSLNGGHKVEGCMQIKICISVIFVTRARCPKKFVPRSCGYCAGAVYSIILVLTQSHWSSCNLEFETLFESI